MSQFENLLGVVIPVSTASVLRDIADERYRQNEKFPGQHLPDGTRESMKSVADAARVMCDMFAAQGELTWRDVLAEEISEAFAAEDPEQLRKELIQVAAVATRWAEEIDNRRVGLA